MSRPPDPGHILITGASSGIGAALARAYAAPGRTLSLGGRDAARLAAVAEMCATAGADCTTQCADVRDPGIMAAWVEACDDARRIDLVIANAGVSAGSRKRTGTPMVADEEILATNVAGVANTIEPVLVRMRARTGPWRGQVAIMASLAGFRVFAGAPAYCESKSAARRYGEDLRRRLAPAGISVSVICPGFVRSPMTDANDFPMPFLIEADRAAAAIVRGLARDRARIAFPWPMYLAVRIAALFP